ncbi:MAG: DUF885 domain-containing protein [Novosphingobium sp.]|nr:DUF885 domain-containing protein [Novosphingobium sp.]
MDMRRVLRTAAPALMLAAGAAPSLASAPAPAETASLTLARMFEQDAARELALDPVEQLFRGDAVDPKLLSRLYTDSLDAERLASAQSALADLATVDLRALDADQRISYDVFRYGKERQAAWRAPDVMALTAPRPFNHFGAPHVEFPALMASDGTAPYETVADYRRAIALNGAFATVLDNAIARFRRGMASGVVEPKLTVSLMIGQLDAVLAEPVEQSLFYSSARDFPPNIPTREKQRLRRQLASVIGGAVYPAYRRLRTFLADEYLPAARDSIGLSGMTGGAGLYRRLIERETTLPLDPDAIHRLGLSEVARIQREMDGVKEKLGFAGPLPAFFEHVRTDPRFHPRSADELRDGFNAIADAVALQIPRYFSKVPKTPLVIRPYPPYRNKYEAGGSYSEGSADGTRPGVFYYNTYDLPGRFLTGMTTLYLHEGSPGHHFQISLAQENESLPAFQRFGGNSAFTEGWALYAETLGYEMGFYNDPRQHWGTLDDEMLRAMRLVVDTGIHARGWSREQAIAYMLANSGMGRTDAAAEVDRYAANPAQALSYKIGGLAIQRLRRKAEAELGKNFDIRAFHGQVLGSGALPLPVLEAKIDRWIAARREVTPR